MLNKTECSYNLILVGSFLYKIQQYWSFRKKNTYRQTMSSLSITYLGVPSICVLILSDISAMLLSLRHAAIVQKVSFSRIKPTSKVKPNC